VSPAGPTTTSEPLITPRDLRDLIPLDTDARAVVEAGRRAVASVLTGTDPRLLVVVGPCSAHDAVAVLEYAARLRITAAALTDHLVIVMRVYLEKPRTTLGWKGLLTDPYLDGVGDLHAGLRLGRGLLRDVLDTGVPVASEILDPMVAPYLADAISWASIGARTVQSQVHRQVASGLPMPVGFKNGTDGNIRVAADAVRAAARPHVFPGADDDGIPSVLRTGGNPYGHVVLRGGHQGANHGPPALDQARKVLRSAGLPERLVVDAAHGNSGGDHRRQVGVAADLAEWIAAGDRTVRGVMLESFLVEGHQDVRDGSSLVYGQSITDECMAWSTTRGVLERLAASAALRPLRATPVSRR